MAEHTLVSIVLPTYNGAHYLPEAVESMIAQTYERWELIIVDDGSTDETPQIIDSFVRRDSRIRSIRHHDNQRLPRSLNDGFALANGQLLTWTSDDNWYRPDALREMVTLLVTHPEADIVYSDYSLVGEDGSDIRPVAVGEPRMLAFVNAIGACFLYTRTVHERLHGYAEDMFLVEDYDFWLRASCQFMFVRIPKDLYCYRVHGGSLSAQQAGAVAEALRRLLCRRLPEMHWIDRGTRAMAYAELGRRALEAGDRSAVWYFIWRAIREAIGILSGAYRSRWGQAAMAQRGGPSDRKTAAQEPFWDLWVYGVAGLRAYRWWSRYAEALSHPVSTLRRKLAGTGAERNRGAR